MSTKVNRLTAAAGSGPPFGPFSGRVGSTHPGQQRPAGRDLLFLGGLALCCNIIIFSFGRDRRRLCADKEILFGPASGDLLFLLRFPLAPVPRPWLPRCRFGLVWFRVIVSHRFVVPLMRARNGLKKRTENAQKHARA